MRIMPTYLIEEDGTRRELYPSVELGVALLMRGRIWGAKHHTAARSFESLNTLQSNPQYHERPFSPYPESESD